MNTIWIALTYIKGLGNKRIKKLYTAFPDLRFADFKGANLQNIKKIIGNKKIEESLSDLELMEEYIQQAEASIRLHGKHEINVVTIADSNYPKLLKMIDDSPIVLYCKGNMELLQTSKSIAVVGTRNPTQKGESMARRIATVFSEKGYVIVSGLALGIDTEAHVATLHASGKTIAVLANGLETIAPRENKKLAEEIVQKEGLLISEYAIGTKTFRAAFVQRDRIQSGLSIGVCPVQTDIEGGTQHTITFAKQQNRLLFSPTPMEQVPATRGIVELLKNGALPINDSNDIDTIASLLEKRLQNMSDTVETTQKREQEDQQLHLFE